MLCVRAACPYTVERLHMQRRKWFRRIALGTLVAGAAAGVGAAFAHGGYGGWHRGGFSAGLHDPAMLDRGIDRLLKHLYVEIDPTEEQKRKLEPIVKQAAKDLLPLHEKAQSARERAIGLVGAEQVDRAAIERFRTEHLQLAEQASRRLTQALGDVAEVLTIEQRKQIAEHMARHRRGGHRG